MRGTQQKTLTIHNNLSVESLFCVPEACWTDKHWKKWQQSSKRNSFYLSNQMSLDSKRESIQEEEIHTSEGWLVRAGGDTVQSSKSNSHYLQ